MGPIARAGRVLFVLASEVEASAFAEGIGLAPPVRGEVSRGDRAFDLVVSGVGKTNAAQATASALAGGSPPAAVINVGIAGALPRKSGPLEVGSVVLATLSLFADEGVSTPDRFIGLSELGFASPGVDDRFPADQGLLQVLSSAGIAGPIATVSTCSGNDASSEAIAERTGAIAEAMEGAAVALAAARAGVPFAEVRVISNRTGDRAHQGWDMSLALATLRRFAAGL